MDITLSRTSEKRGGRLLVCGGRRGSRPPAPLDLFIASLDALTSRRASERVSSTLSARIDSDERARPSSLLAMRKREGAMRRRRRHRDHVLVGGRKKGEVRIPRISRAAVAALCERLYFEGTARGAGGKRRASFDGKDTAEGRARLSRRRVAVTREGLFLLARPAGPFSTGERNCDAIIAS